MNVTTTSLSQTLGDIFLNLECIHFDKFSNYLTLHQFWRLQTATEDKKLYSLIRLRTVCLSTINYRHWLASILNLARFKKLPRLFRHLLCPAAYAQILYVCVLCVIMSLLVHNVVGLIAAKRLKTKLTTVLPYILNDETWHQWYLEHRCFFFQMTLTEQLISR